jgi:steroid delta-isomerase-like uncharacterized protein
MTLEENAAIAQALNDAYNARDWERALALTALDVETRNVPTRQVFHGPAGMRQFLEGWATAFPDSQVETTLLIAGDQGAAIEFVGRGTHTGPLAGPAGDIPPTGRTVDVPFAQVLELRDGKIVRLRLYFDTATLLQQLGVLPASAPDAT